ncbi:MAG: translocation/assembly module TamB domain-containing protein [Desulfobacterales bacterium]
MKFIKRVSMVIGFILAIVLLGVLGIQLYLNTEPVKEKIQARINQAISGTLTWRTSRFSVLNGEMELTDVLLKGPSNNRLVELNRVRIHVSWIGFLTENFTIKDLLLENPKIFLSQDHSGNLNLIQALKAPGNSTAKLSGQKGLPFNIILRRLKLVNGFFQYHAADNSADKQKDLMIFRNVNLLISDGNLFARTGRISSEVGSGDIRFRNLQMPVDQLSLKANIHEDRIEALVFNVNTSGFYVNLAGRLDKPFTKNPVLNLTLKSRFSLSQIKHVITTAPDFSGEFQVDSNLKGTIRNPDINLQLIYKGGKLAGRRIDRIHLKCRLKDRYLNVIDSNAKTPLGRFDIKGSVDFTKAISDDLLPTTFNSDAVSYKFFIRHKAPRLENTVLGKSGLKGAAHAGIEVEGKGFHPKTLWAETTLEVYGDKLSAEQLRSSIDAHVKARAAMANGCITIQDLTANADGTQLKMDGTYDVFSRQTFARFELTSPDLSETLSKLGISGIRGTVNATGEMHGTTSEPFIQARLKGENLGYNKVRFGSADADFSFSKGRLSLIKGKITNADSNVDFSGDLQIVDPIHTRLLRDPAFNFALNADSLFLENFVEGMKGKFVLNGRFKGNFGHPKGLLDLYGKDVDLGIQKIHDLRLASRLEGGRVNVDPLTLAIVPGEKIVLKGWVSTDKHYELNMISSNISIKNIEKLTSLNMDKGKLSFDLSGKGKFSNPQFKGKAVLDGLAFNNKKLRKISLNIGVENQTAYLEGGPDFDLKATYELQTRSFSASARFDHTDLTPYLQLLGEQELSGTVTGIIDIKGNYSAPLQIDGAIKIAQLALFWKNKALISGRDLGIFVNKDKITVPKMRLSLLEKGYFTISGTGKLWRNIDLKAEGIIPFDIFPMFTDSVSDAGGKARFSLRVTENGSQPSFDFDADLENGNVMIPGLFQKFHDINGHIRATPKAVILDNIKGMLGAGRFELSGDVDLDRYRLSKLGLRLKADDLPITIPDLLDVRLSSELDVRGSLEKSLIKGNIMILEGRYSKDVRLNPIENIAQESRAAPLVTSKTPWPVFDNMAIDCRIKYKDPFVVDNNIALLAIKPDLYIHGTVNKPLISGRAEVESGTVYFRRNEFNVKKGVLDFINPYKIEPTIDIQGDVKIREWTVFLNVSGTPDNLKFDLSSDPSESEQDIISLLITGKTTRELVAGEGGSSLSAKQMLADVLAESAQKEIKDATGLDIVALEYNEAKDAEASDEVKVTVGKELSKRVTVKYGVQTKNAKVIQKVITEYKILEKLLVEAFEDNEGHYGGGIQFRLEFR